MLVSKFQSGNNNNTLSTNNNNPNSNNNNLKETINLTTNGNGGGSLGSTTDKESLTPSPSARSTDDVKTEPMELVSNSISHDDEHSNDSVVDADRHSSNGNESKGPLRYVELVGCDLAARPHAGYWMV